MLSTLTNTVRVTHIVLLISNVVSQLIQSILVFLGGEINPFFNVLWLAIMLTVPAFDYWFLNDW